MEVVRSEIISYCYGVSNTLNLADECLKMAKEKGCPCYSIGSLIHNMDVIEKYRQLGMEPVHSPEGLKPGVALVRAHGISDAMKRDFEKAGFIIVDSTCPTVQKGARRLRDAVKGGRKAIIIGVKNHAETNGLLGVEVEEGKTVGATLVCDYTQAKSLIQNRELSSREKVFVVTQTTFPEKEYMAIRKLFSSYFQDIVFGNRPCPSCEGRKLAALKVLDVCEAAVVVGGSKSENTKDLARRLYELKKPVFLIENASSIDDELIAKLSSFEKIALCSGSSTPLWVIDEVAGILKRITK